MLWRRARRIRDLAGILGFDDAAVATTARPSSNRRQRTARRGANATAGGRGRGRRTARRDGDNRASRRGRGGESARRCRCSARAASTQSSRRSSRAGPSLHGLQLRVGGNRPASWPPRVDGLPARSLRARICLRPKGLRDSRGRCALLLLSVRATEQSVVDARARVRSVRQTSEASRRRGGTARRRRGTARRRRGTARRWPWGPRGRRRGATRRRSCCGLGDMAMLSREVSGWHKACEMREVAYLVSREFASPTCVYTGATLDADVPRARAPANLRFLRTARTARGEDDGTGVEPRQHLARVLPRPRFSFCTRHRWERRRQAGRSAGLRGDGGRRRNRRRRLLLPSW